MTQLGILLLVVGLAIVGLGIAGRIRAAKLAGPRKSNRPRSPGRVIYEARRLYEDPERGLTVDHLEKSGNRLIVSGVTLCAVGIILIL